MSDDAVTGPAGDDAGEEMSVGGVDASAVGGAGQAPAPESASTAEGADGIPPLGRAIAVYTVIRVGLIVVLTVILALAGRPFGMPPIVALAFAIVLQLPLSVVMFRKQRNDLTAALARAKSKRTAERDRLFTELTGHEPQD